MAGDLTVGSVAAGMPRQGVEPPPVVVFIVVALVVAGIVVVATVRVIPEHQRLVVWRLGGAPVVRGPGLVWVLPGIDRWERVWLRVDPLETWSQAFTRDGVLLRLKIIAVVSVIDPARYAARAAEPSASADVAAGVIVEGQVRRYIAERDLTQLTVMIAGGVSPVPDAGDAARRWVLGQWGLAVSVIQIVQADVPLHSLHHWTARAPAAPTASDPGRS
ncbi:SPFH domain-containing protein [Actinomadura rudentiformis]|uniref:Band 7 domain-containing protein n=1 Tax=Actinomadura rudentiformis TaxID=359158 RepID=A0A6H9YAH1_9ACTN|nr:SPFH domain-containing protein [Actinomadura rudentiformis]KAB2341618.1 hypothetical protein F8566_41545 [Actinomadura rudentiformis]